MSMVWEDSQRRRWSCRITIADAKRLREGGTDIANPEVFELLFSNPINQVEMIAELLRPQWEKATIVVDNQPKQMEYTEFVDVLTEVEGRFQEVQRAFIEGLKDFFLRLGDLAKAKIVEKAADAARKTVEAQLERASGPEVDALIAKAHEVDEARFNSAMDKALRELSGPTSTTAPES